MCFLLPPLARPPSPDQASDRVLHWLGAGRRSQLLRERFSDMGRSPLFGGAEAPVVGSCLGETQRTIGPTSDHVGILVVLPIVFPETDRTDVIAAALRQCLAATARAPVRARFSSRLANGMVVQ